MCLAPKADNAWQFFRDEAVGKDGSQKGGRKVERVCLRIFFIFEALSLHKETMRTFNSS